MKESKYTCLSCDLSEDQIIENDFSKCGCAGKNVIEVDNCGDCGDILPIKEMIPCEISGLNYCTYCRQSNIDNGRAIEETKTLLDLKR